jgi:hypothetical protein
MSSHGGHSQYHHEQSIGAGVTGFVSRAAAKLDEAAFTKHTGIVAKILRNILNTPDEPKFRKLKLSVLGVYWGVATMDWLHLLKHLGFLPSLDSPFNAQRLEGFIMLPMEAWTNPFNCTCFPKGRKFEHFDQYFVMTTSLTDAIQCLERPYSSWRPDLEPSPIAPAPVDISAVDEEFQAVLVSLGHDEYTIDQAYRRFGNNTALAINWIENGKSVGQIERCESHIAWLYG